VPDQKGDHHLAEPAQAVRGTTVAFLSTSTTGRSCRWVHPVGRRDDQRFEGGPRAARGRLLLPRTAVHRPGARGTGQVEAPMGRFAVLGNHDHWDGLQESIDGLEEAGTPLLRNSGAWVEKGLARLRIGGVGDLWCDDQDIDAALGTRPLATLCSCSRTPRRRRDASRPRVGLMLSGHTHGGQVIVPFFGAPIVTSATVRSTSTA